MGSVCVCLNIFVYLPLSAALPHIYIWDREMTGGVGSTSTIVLPLSWVCTFLFISSPSDTGHPVLFVIRVLVDTWNALWPRVDLVWLHQPEHNTHYCLTWKQHSDWFNHAMLGGPLPFNNNNNTLWLISPCASHYKHRMLARLYTPANDVITIILPPLSLKWERGCVLPIPYIVHYFSTKPCGPWSKIMHCIGKGAIWDATRE